MLSPSLQSMTENFEAEVCGAGTTWPWQQQWNHHPSIINNGLFSNPSSPACCSSGFNNMGDHFGLINNPEFLLGNNKAWSSGDESTTGNSPSDSSLVVQDMQHQHQHQMINSSIDSSSEILGIGLSSNSMTTDDWNRALLHGGGSSEALNYTSMLQQEGHGQGGCSQQIQKNFENPTINSFESVNHDNNDFSSEKKPLINTSPSNNFPIISTTTGGGPYGYSSSDLLQINNLFENESSDQTKQVPLYDTSKLMNGFQATTLLNEFSRNSLTELSSSSSSLEKQKPTNLLQLSDHNKTAADFCNNNGSAAAIALNDFPVSLSPPSGSQFFHTKPNHGKRPTSVPSFKAMIQNDEIEGLGTVTNKKSNCVPTFKRPRIETPTPLPTFKVRKEKMGDRITALQQLVSPFGKTDTASVLHEAIEYIKFLHDQVNVLSTPYLKNGAPVQRVQNYDKSKKKETKQDLKSRGLCLVPISSTFPVAAENTTDFWIPTFGGTFR